MAGDAGNATGMEGQVQIPGSPGNATCMEGQVQIPDSPGNAMGMEGQVQIPGSPGNATGMEGVDWRTRVEPDLRPRIVHKIIKTLKYHLPFSGPEVLPELKKVADRFEEKIYAAATSQSDYLRRISLKMLAIGIKVRAQNLMANSLQSSAASTNKNSQETEEWEEDEDEE